MTPDSEFKKLVELVETLRGANGCPWDKKQTVESMHQEFLEEVEEVKEAIQKKDYHNLKEELGDILLTVIMMSQIAKEEKLFNLKEVLAGINHKVISRHTWVFGKDNVSSPEEALAMWKKNKKKEKNKGN